MDERNGPIFDHHEDLFAQIADHETIKDFVLEMTGSLPRDGGAPSSSASVDMWSHCASRGPETHSYPMLNSSGLCPPLVPPIIPQTMQYDINLAGQVDNSSTFLDNFAKSIPDELLDGYHNMDALKRNMMPLPEKPPQYQPIANPPAAIHHSAGHPGALHDTMHRISTDKSTQDYLDLLTKSSDADYLFNNLVVKPTEHPSWNGIDHCVNYSTGVVNKPPIANPPLRATDKNGNCSTIFNNGLSEKTKNNFCPSNVDSGQSYLVKGLSPSVSVESGIHTGSYDSASPLSSGRTPLRSDDSISPLTSCTSPAASVRTPASPLPRTPVRTDDCFSPGRVRRPDNSPIVRTPLRCEETPSPRAVSRTPLRNDDAPSPRPVARTPLRNDDASSPRQIARTPLRGDEAASPRPKPPTPLRNDDAHSPRSATRTPHRTEEIPSPRSVNRTPGRHDDVGWTPSRIDEAPSPRTLNRTPARCNEEAPPRTPFRADDVPSPRVLNRTPTRVDSSPLARGDPSPHSQRESSPRTQLSASPSCANKQVADIKSPSLREYETADLRRESHTPDLQAGPEATPLPQCTPVRTLDDSAQSDSAVPRSAPDPGPSRNLVDVKPRKRRKTDSMCIQSPKKRLKKKPAGTLIYQSSVSGEESGIKLKIKLTNPVPQKRRRRRTGGDGTNDNVEEKPKKRGKRSPVSPSEQSPWGRDIPVPVLERIFKLVADDQGCVPSLVRFSWVCRLWNQVSNKTELWQNVDLSSPCIKQKCKIDRYFRWLLENRLGTLRDLNLNGWKFSNLPMVLSLIGTHCSEVENIGLSGWQGLHFEHLRSLLKDCPRLSRMDLSDVSPESKSTNSAVSPKSITYLTETMGERLKEINLAHNTLSCLPQIISSLATHCPNLQVLDLSNIRRASHAEFALNLEELQQGCPQLRVLRITNSSVTLASVPFDQQAASPGFPALEELSIAAHQSTESLRITAVMDDDSLERMVRNAVKLRLLDVRGCTRITESSLVRVPAWDIQHLFLSGCLVTRQSGSGLELIAQKWSHSLVEIDLAWASVTEDLNAAIHALAERGDESPLRFVNLCGSAVEPEPVRSLLTRCPNLESINLQSCRGLPRGVKRLYEREQLPELLELLQPSIDTTSDA